MDDTILYGFYYFSDATYSGTLKQELSYDARGRLRDPATHVAYAPGTEPALFLGRGFTGHEYLPWFGLINMNARLYDPALGRFLSPDPYVQVPDFTQSFNRYSYCLNNPLMFADPSGEKLKLWHWLLIDFFTGGTISTFTSTASTATITSTLAGTIVQTYINVWSGDCDRADNTWKIWFGLFKTYKNLSFGDRIIQFGSRFTWEGPQTDLGYNSAQIRSLFGGVDDVKYFCGATLVNRINTNYHGHKGTDVRWYETKVNKQAADYFEKCYGVEWDDNENPRSKDIARALKIR